MKPFLTPDQAEMSMKGSGQKLNKMKKEKKKKCVWKGRERQVLEKRPELDHVGTAACSRTLGLQVTCFICTHSIAHHAYTSIKE